MLKLLFGKLTLKRVFAILIPGLFAGFFLFWFHPNPTGIVWLTSILTIDLVSGMISNQLEDTHRAWQNINPLYAYFFIGFHAVVYPGILLLIEKDYLVLGSLLLILSVKLYGFIRGYFLT